MCHISLSNDTIKHHKNFKMCRSLRENLVYYAIKLGIWTVKSSHLCWIILSSPFIQVFKLKLCMNFSLFKCYMARPFELKNCFILVLQVNATYWICNRRAREWKENPARDAWKPQVYSTEWEHHKIRVKGSLTVLVQLTRLDRKRDPVNHTPLMSSYIRKRGS